MRWIGLVILVLATSARAAIEQPVGGGGEPLSQVIQSRQVGLGSAADLRGPHPLERIQGQVRQYIQFRRGRMDGKTKAVALAECVSAPAENVFCEPMLARGLNHPGPAPGSPAGPASQPQISPLMAEGDPAKLRGLSEAQLHRALRWFDSWEPLKKLAAAIADGPGCVWPALATAMGQKAEEYLPADGFRREAERMYSRAVACGGPGEEASVAKARFRLALLRIWAGDCKTSDPLLRELSRDHEGEFTSRAIFWRAYCARHNGDKLGYAALKSRLRREFPLSFHSVALLDHTERRGISFLAGGEPSVLFRSAVRPELNSIVAAAELLQKEQAMDLSSELLDAYQDKVEQGESAFRLYVAVLYQRAGSTLGVFRTLSGVFQADASAVSLSALEIFYPLHRFGLISAASSSKVDPFLIAALIRQESGFNPRARSPVGALGLMQLMPATARRYGPVGRRRLLDSATNVRVGTRYFSALLDRFQGDAELALAAYNAGPEKVEEWRRRYPVANRHLFLDLIPYQETRNYVSLIGRNYFWYRHLYGPGSVREPSSGGKKPARWMATAQANFPSLERGRGDGIGW